MRYRELAAASVAPRLVMRKKNHRSHQAGQRSADDIGRDSQQ